MRARTSFVLLAAVAGVAAAATATYPKAGPDEKGLSQHWVKCDNGNVSTVQCLKDEHHCGSGHQGMLLSEAEKICESMTGLMLETQK